MSSPKKQSSQAAAACWMTIKQLQAIHPGFTLGWLYKFARRAESYALGHLVQRRGGRPLIESVGFMAAFTAGGLDNRVLVQRAQQAQLMQAAAQAGKKLPKKALAALPVAPEKQKPRARWMKVLEAGA